MIRWLLPPLLTGALGAAQSEGTRPAVEALYESGQGSRRAAVLSREAFTAWLLAAPMHEEGSMAGAPYAGGNEIADANIEDAVDDADPE